MPKHKNEDANAAAPFRKNQFCAASLADITLHQEKMHLKSRNHQLDANPGIIFSSALLKNPHPQIT